jgi:hypothetical protein
MDKIYIEIRGGVVEIASCPKNCQVVVRDYDTECYDEDELSEDDFGNRYREYVI